MQIKLLAILILNLLLASAGSAETFYSSKAGTWCWARYGKSYCFRKLPVNNADDTFVVDREIKLEGNFILEGNLIIEEYGKLIITGEGSLEIKGSLDVHSTGTLHVNNNLTVYDGSLVKVGEYGTIFVAGEFQNLNFSEELMIDGSLEVMGMFKNEGIISGLGKVVAAGGCTESPDATVFGYSDCEGTNVFTLPVTILFFNGVPQKGHILFSWTTSEEKNLDYFTVEHSLDLEIFNEVAKISVAENNSYKNSYFIKVNNPRSGLSYYRLKSADINGRVSFNNLITVNFEMEELKKLSLFPNPLAADQLEIQLNFTPDPNSKVIIRNLTGQEIFTTTLPESNQRIHLPQPLEPGLYILSLSEGGSNYQSRLIVR